ncbi:hypothetical protein L1887_53980 [Cichorium endivia]|nr:hypothetical protein L1887_53980 [Cichorium endivia]
MSAPHDLEERVEGGAGRSLSGRVVDELHDDGQKRGVLGSALLLEHLAKAAERDAGGLADDGVAVLETGLDEGPEVVHVGADVLGAALDGDTKGHHGGLAVVRVGVGHVGLHLLEQGREDVAGGQLGGETVDDAEGETRGRVLVDVVRVLFDGDGHEAGDHVLGEAEALHLGALVGANPDERVEAHEAEVLLVLGVGAIGEEKVDELCDVVGDDGHLEHADLFKHVEDLADAVLVALLEALVEHADHLGHGGLHGGEVCRGVALEVLGDLAEGHGRWCLVEGLAAVDEGLEDGVEDEERDLPVGGVGRVGGVEEEGEEVGPRAEGQLTLGDLGDDAGDGVADGGGLLVGDDLEELGLDAVADVYRLLVPDLAAALCETLAELDSGELTNGEVGRGGEDLEERRHALRVLVVVVLESIGGSLDGVGVWDVALLEELVQPLHEGGLLVEKESGEAADEYVALESSVGGGGRAARERDLHP